MANPLDLLAFAKRAWESTSQPLKERGIPGAQDPQNVGVMNLFSLPVIADMVAPVGTYEDGSIGPAWPKLAAGIGDALQRGYTSSNEGFPAINDDEAWRQKSIDMFDVTSLAPIGGLAMTAAGVGAPRGAIGSAGAKLGQAAADLPMDLASRMARARELGFDTDRTWYHGTPAQFDEFQPSAMGSYGPGVYLTDSRMDAGEWMRRAQPANRGRLSSELDQANYNLRNASGQGEEAYTAARQEADAIREKMAFPGEVKSLNVRGDLFNADSGVVMDGWVPRTYASLEKKYGTVGAQEILKQKGYSGLSASHDGRSVATIFDPKNIRSTSAAFDPVKSDSANLLAANAKSGVAVPLAANALERSQPQGIRAYHGGQTKDWRTGQEYTELNSRNGPWSAFFSDDPNVANRFAGSYSDGAGVFPVDLRMNNPLEIDAQGRPASEFQFDKNKGWNWSAQDRKTGEVSRDAQGFSELFPYTDEFRSAITSPDHDGVILKNTKDEGNVYIPTKRGTVYSATTGDLLYSNAPTGSLPSLAAQTQEQDADPALLQVLRQYGML